MQWFMTKNGYFYLIKNWWLEVSLRLKKLVWSTATLNKGTAISSVMLFYPLWRSKQDSLYIMYAYIIWNTTSLCGFSFQVVKYSRSSAAFALLLITKWGCKRKMGSKSAYLCRHSIKNLEQKKNKIIYLKILNITVLTVG